MTTAVPAVTLPTIDRLKELFRYDPGTGLLVWRVDKGRARRGRRAGSQRPDGRWQVQIDGRNYLNARVIFAMETGAWPPELVDHADTDGANNRRRNLRAATRSQNGANRQGWSASGLKGVYRRGSKWAAAIRVDGRIKHLGTFISAGAAARAYDDAARTMFGRFARPNFVADC